MRESRGAVCDRLPSLSVYLERSDLAPAHMVTAVDVRDASLIDKNVSTIGQLGGAF